MAVKFRALGEEARYVHPPTWVREPTTGPERLTIGPGERPVDVLQSLVGALPEPLFILVLLDVPRVGDPGRYESEALTAAEVRAFLDDFEQFFTQDARAQVWVGAVHGEGLLVLDEHDLIYAYGPLDRLEAELGSHGFVVDPPVIPVPHEHLYNQELDADEIRILEWPRWQRVLPPRLEDAD